MEKNSMTILLVEDNEGDVELTKIAFRKAQLSSHLFVVHDGEEALEYLYKRGKFQEALLPDIILIDLNMPRMGGKEFLRLIKNDDKFKAIPVIILTSSQSPAEILECYKCHASCYILKPPSFDKFIALVKQLESFWMDLVLLPYRMS